MRNKQKWCWKSALMTLFSQPGKKQENLVWNLRGKTENFARINGWISDVETAKTE